MLESIFESLIEGGELYILEPEKKAGYCYKVMKESRIIKLVTSKYFISDQKKDVNGVILYRFIRK